MQSAERTAHATSQARDDATQYLLGRHRFRWWEALPWLAIAAAYLVFPDRMTFGAQVLVMVLFALSLDLILGYAGIVTLGHAAFFGLGAYTVALGAAKLGWNEPISGLFAAAIVAAIVGFVSGWFLLRYRGLTLLMLTLATAIMLQEFGNYRSDFTGGYDGVPGISFKPLFGLFEYDLYGHVNYIYVAVVLLVMFFVVRRIIFSPFGQALTGIRENVRRMHAIGSPVHRRLVTVYTIAAGIAGVAGALYAQTNAYATLTAFDFEVSAKVMVMLILGGTGRLYGAFVGAAIYMVLEDNLSKLSPAFWQFGIGLLLVLTVMFARRGLLGLAEDIGSLFSKRGGAAARPAAAVRQRAGGRRLALSPLAMSALDGGLIGLVGGFAIEKFHTRLMLSWLADSPAQVLVWVVGGAAVAVAINLVALAFAPRRTV